MNNSKQFLVFLVALLIFVGFFPTNVFVSRGFSVESGQSKELVKQQRQLTVEINNFRDRRSPSDNQIGILDNTLLIFIVPLLILAVLGAFVAGFVFVWTHYSVFLAVLSVVSGMTLLGSAVYWLLKRKYYRKHAIFKGWKLGWLLSLLVVYIGNFVLTLIIALKGIDTLVYVLIFLDFAISLIVGYLAYWLSRKAQKKLEGLIPRLN